MIIECYVMRGVSDGEGVPRYALLSNLPSVTEYHVDDLGDTHVYHFFFAGVTDEETEVEEADGVGENDTTVTDGDVEDTER
jgi:hypothetical protein